MGKRQDGRIEPGQKLAGAISARAWNRAQDAADIVLGERLGFAAGPGAAFTGALIVPCQVTTTVEGVRPGHVVAINEAGATVLPDVQSETDTRCARVYSFVGQIVTPVTYQNYNDSLKQFGVIVAGATMPRPSSPRIVQVCISGMCVARVKMRGLGEFLRRPVIRAEEDTAESLAGMAEQSSCGPHRIVQEIGSADPEDEDIKFCAVIL
jgi:hypothetical protein